jgi:hypothetical protein
MEDILPQEEIQEMTGLTQPAAQEKLLRAWGLVVFRNRANKVILSREAFIRWQLGERAQRAEKAPRVKLLHESTPA